MARDLLCLGLAMQFELPFEEQIKLFADTGFDGFFAGYGADIPALRAAADETGMVFQSVHASFTKMDAMWEPMEKTQTAIDELVDCIRKCADSAVPITVAHAFIGFDKHSPSQFGIDNFAIAVDEARRLGVKLALENTEGEEYLKALMDAFAGEKHVGFCWDTGHEMCYNRSKDMLALYGERLFCTHINDNLGIKAYDGTITFLDDLHLLPFDGIGNWTDAAARLDAHNYREALTFELNRLSKPNRHENDPYMRMSITDYITEAYKRACRVAALRKPH